jgi:hypothetical protein
MVTLGVQSHALSTTSPIHTYSTLLLHLYMVLYQHQNSPDDILNHRLSALPLPTVLADL